MNWVNNVNCHRKEIWKLTFRALALHRSELNLFTESLYGSQFTLSTQLIKPNYLVLPPTDAASPFLQKLFLLLVHLHHLQCDTYISYITYTYITYITYISKDTYIMLETYPLYFTIPECQSYQSLTEPNRKVTYALATKICDSSIGPGWFRFHGDAGIKMPTSCPPMQMCDTHAPGWINGEHPTVADGKVTRKVCFHWSSNCCHWSTDIEVRNCGSYYIYYLSGTPTCAVRYCGTD